MALRRLYDICPNEAAKLGLEVEITTEPGLPKGWYVFTEAYCDDPSCDCRYVALAVYRMPEPEDQSVYPEAIAQITYGWESPAFYTQWLGMDEETGQMMSGVSLDPLYDDSPVAQAFRNYVEEQIVENPELAAPLELHYQMVKSRVKALAARKANRLVPIRRKTKKKHRR